VALHVPAQPGDPGQPQIRAGRIGGSQAGDERRLIRDGIELLAHGALVCPRCDLPLEAGARIPAGSPLRCGFCDHTATARAFVRQDVYDTLGNEVYVVARL
jgi:hypothetical protein